MRRELRQLYYRALATLYRNTDDVEVLDYPDRPERQSINLIARLREDKPVLLKITYDIEELSQADINELKALALTLNIPAAIVAEKRGKKELVDGVIYEKKRIPVITPEDLERILAKGKGAGIYVYQYKDSYKVKINSDVLKERRIEKGFSLGDIALMLNVSRKLVYEYERGSTDPTLDKAEKLIEILGDDIIEPIDPFDLVSEEDFKPKVDFDNEIEERLALILSRHDYKIAHAKRTAIDIAASKYERILFMVKHKRESVDRTIKKADNLVRISKMVMAKPIAITDEKQIEKELSYEEFKIFKPKELNILLREIDVLQRLGSNRKARCG